MRKNAPRAGRSTTSYSGFFESDDSGSDPDSSGNESADEDKVCDTTKSLNTNPKFDKKNLVMMHG